MNDMPLGDPPPKKMEVGDPYMWDGQRWRIRDLYDGGTIGLVNPDNPNHGTGVGRSYTVWSARYNAWMTVHAYRREQQEAQRQ